MQIKDDIALIRPGKLKGDPSKRSRDKYCHFYRDHDHDTSKSYDLKQQIEAFIRQGKLQRFVSKERAYPPQEQVSKRDNECPKPPIGDIKMIIGGNMASSSSKKACKTYLRMVQNVQLTNFVPKMARVNNLIIGFLEEDAWLLHHLYNDALIVSIQVGDYNTHHVLVDNGSSTDILYYPAFQQIRIERKQLILANVPLVGLGGTRIYPLDAVTFLVMVDDYPQQLTKDVTFLVVNCSSAYSAILGQPTLNSWKAVTKTYYLMIKFPTKYEVGEVRGNQVVARECYIAMLEMDDYLQTMNIEKQKAVVEPVEGLKEILLNNSRPE
nr:uncharacterized protein LOC112014387 [Quercus suber]